MVEVRIDGPSSVAGDARDVPLMDYIQKLRGHVSVLWEALWDVLLLQEDLRALRSEQSAFQPGVDLGELSFSKDLLPSSSTQSRMHILA